MTFDAFAEVYISRYVVARDLAPADTIDCRMAPIRRYFGKKLLGDIRQADIEDFITELKKPGRLTEHQKADRVRRPATINRYVSLLRHMFNWAVGLEYLDRSPMRRGNVNLILGEREDSRRHRRVSADEEQRLFQHAPQDLRPMIVVALDSGMRRGEVLALRWSDVDERPGWIRVRGETAKSGRTRWVPVSTTRFQAVLDYLRLDAEGQGKQPETLVFSNEAGEPLSYQRKVWVRLLRQTGISDLRWHDLRREYASRLVEHGVPLSQVRDLLGHASITTTERYDNQKPEALQEAAKLLETDDSLKIPSRSDGQSLVEARLPSTKPTPGCRRDWKREVGWVTGFEHATSGATEGPADASRVRCGWDASLSGTGTRAFRVESLRHARPCRWALTSG